MKILKDLLKSTVISVGMALAIFCFVGMFFDIINGGTFTLADHKFTKMVIGSALVGIGFGVPSMVYNSEKLPMPVKVLIHMGIGCTIYTLVAYSVGWFGGSATITQGLVIAAIQLIVAFVIWFCFMRFYRREAKQMNEKIQEMKK